VRNANASGIATVAGTRRDCAYAQAAALNPIQPAAITTLNVFSGGRIAASLRASLVITFCIMALPAAETPPADLIRRIAHHEDETVEARNNYAYRQSVRLQELNDHGGEVGRYTEVRDIVFSPEHERSEKQVSTPVENLKNLQMTAEDFQDIREIQPFVLREESIRNYDVKFRGEETMDGVDCWVVQIRPKQILQSQRFFEGLLWASKKDYSIIRTEGQAVPQIYSLHQENLFPRFTTIRKPVGDNFWFPAVTYADDTLPFHTGPLRVKLTIRYTNYQRFGSSTIITFDEK
jgi:hypothetical protein